MSVDAPPPEVDRNLRGAVDLLNRLPGVATRASCQGKTPLDPGTHADLAYVLFDEPIPLTLEDRLLVDVGEIARVEPDGVHCRWPERNGEFCGRLEESARRRGGEHAAERWERSTISVAEAARALVVRILGERAGDVAWCLDCRRVGDASEHASHGSHLLFRSGDERTLAVFAAYLAQDPPDPRLLEREGVRAVLERLRRGDFGAAYRAGWRRFVEATAARALREEIRSRVRELRSPEWTSDVYVDGATLVLSGRPLG